MSFKALAALAGAILIGALGNAVWEYLLKPVLPWLSNFTLDVATLGAQSLRDQMYVEIAKGNHERAAVSLLAAFYGIGVAIFAFFALNTVVFRFRKQFTEMIQRMAKRLSGDVETSKSGWTWFFVSNLVFAGLAIGFFVIATARTTYIVRAANHLDQFQRVVAPYLSSDQRLQLSSRVAQISKEADYRSIVGEMTEIAQRNHLIVPSFDIR